MRKAKASKGYFLCFIWNLIFNLEWVLVALILYLLHFWTGIPAWISLIGLGIWLLVALFLTALVAWGAACSNEPTPVQENKNPYSAKNADFLNPPGAQNVDGRGNHDDRD
jgi:ABC-type protease/lipase transport system fused ATPase/permease subunit